ncbi:MBL fold metallo-hydrolase [Candidatus Hecatella orcuttiae]|uniref:MBL fold metallo-hydrolase n=1 Tax=Candidatus Hecatella orcuttiae TaxID=1935119 RepID=UPI0028681E16|nr:MBL fold metallo-hydrolase [Candidatus Hecatella orcuttiae]
MEVFFLGTGGGRFATITQKRKTAGLRILSGRVNLHIDPGPGALVYSIQAGLDPRKVRAVLITHAHPDHCNDGEVMVEAMTGGAIKKQGYLVCAKSVLRGNEVCDPAVSRYHQGLPREIAELSSGGRFEFEGVKVQAVKAVHYDPDTVGFKVFLPGGESLGYTSDAEYFEGMGAEYQGVDLLILCTMRPRGSPLKWHMSVDDAVKVLEEAHPKQAVLTHFGMRMLTENMPELEAEYVEKTTGIPTVSAYDGMRLKVEREKEKRDLTSFF